MPINPNNIVAGTDSLKEAINVYKAAVNAAHVTFRTSVTNIINSTYNGYNQLKPEIRNYDPSTIRNIITWMEKQAQKIWLKQVS